MRAHVTLHVIALEGGWSVEKLASLLGGKLDQRTLTASPGCRKKKRVFRSGGKERGKESVPPRE